MSPLGFSNVELLTSPTIIIVYYIYIYIFGQLRLHVILYMPPIFFNIIKEGHYNLFRKNKLSQYKLFISELCCVCQLGGCFILL